MNPKCTHQEEITNEEVNEEMEADEIITGYKGENWNDLDIT